MSENYYWRVVIARKDISDSGPVLEVASFRDETIAEGYIENIVKKSKEWDDDKLFACRLLYALPPWTCDNENLENKIIYLKSLNGSKENQECESSK